MNTSRAWAVGTTLTVPAPPLANTSRMRWFAAFARACGVWPTYGALKVKMSRLKKRSVAGGGAVSGAAAATMGNGVGGEAPLSAASATAGDTTARRTRILEARHISLRPSLLNLFSFSARDQQEPRRAQHQIHEHADAHRQ